MIIGFGNEVVALLFHSGTANHNASTFSCFHYGRFDHKQFVYDLWLPNPSFTVVSKPTIISDSGSTSLFVPLNSSRSNHDYHFNFCMKFVELQSPICTHLVPSLAHPPFRRRKSCSIYVQRLP